MPGQEVHRALQASSRALHFLADAGIALDRASDEFGKYPAGNNASEAARALYEQVVDLQRRVLNLELGD